MLFPAVGYMLCHGLLRLLAAGILSRVPLWEERELSDIAGAVSSCLLAPLLVLWYWKREGRIPLPTVTKKTPGLCLELAAAGAGMALTTAFVCVLTAADLQADGNLSAAEVLGMAVAGPVCEEVIYRGLVFGRGEKLLGRPGAVLVSSLLFGAAHGSLLQMGMAVAAGVLFCLIRLRSRSLCAAVFVHMGVNLLLFRNEIYCLPRSVYTTGACALAIVLVYFICRIRKEYPKLKEG